MNDYNKYRRTMIYFVGAAIILFMAFSFFKQQSPAPQDSERLSNLAQCLKESGATFYGTFWCSHCQSQKEMFGSAASKLPYIECSTPDGKSQLPICAEKEITGYPTWIFADGSRVLGDLSLEDLASRSGCELLQ